MFYLLSYIVWSCLVLCAVLSLLFLSCFGFVLSWIMVRCVVLSCLIFLDFFWIILDFFLSSPDNCLRLGLGLAYMVRVRYSV